MLNITVEFEIGDNTINISRSVPKDIDDTNLQLQMSDLINVAMAWKDTQTVSSRVSASDEF